MFLGCSLNDPWMFPGCSLDGGHVRRGQWENAGGVLVFPQRSCT
jgi:hypothetical protein